MKKDENGDCKTMPGILLERHKEQQDEVDNDDKDVCLGVSVERNWPRKSKRRRGRKERNSLKLFSELVGFAACQSVGGFCLVLGSKWVVVLVDE